MGDVLEQYDAFIEEYQRQYDEITLLAARTTTLERENTILKTQNANLLEDLKKLSPSRTDKVERNDAAKNNTSLLRRVSQLEQSLRESKIEATIASKEFERKEEELKLALSRAQKEIEFLQVSSKEPSLELVPLGPSSIEMHSQEVMSMLEENYQHQLEMMRIVLVERQEELLTAKKENTNLRQSYDLKIHELRMKYEEQLLKVAQESGGSHQVEQLRNKLISQKKESDAEIAKLKAMITKM